MGMSTIRQSTPPNHVQAVTGARQSARIRTPLARPGFIQTHTDSQRALSLAPASPGARTQVSVLSDSVNQSVSENQSESVAGDSSVPGQPVVVNLEQDSDDENAKVKAPKNVKGGFDNPKLYFFPGGAAPGQTHRDGSITSTGLRKACPGRLGAINAGAKLPISADDEDSAIQSKKNATGTLNAFVQKGFRQQNNEQDSCTLQRHFFDILSDLGCSHARKLYVTLQEQVIWDIRGLKLKNQIQAPASLTKPSYFPALEMIAEGKEDDEETHADNEIQEIMESDDGDEIDPDDASEGCILEEEQECTSKETNSANETSGKTTKRGYVEGGIGHTLAKVCQRYLPI
ncbi:hypothetical protein KEM48_005518 [Puccinia striiformis f. sp. tritici PST-130]|nr:hypothetical protein KEM48_005518 [Puccinia striiformis f. sp. tritici PST-130]